MTDLSPPNAGARLLKGLRRFGPLILIVAALIAALASGVLKHLTLHELRARRDLLEAAVRAHPLVSLISYVGAYTLSVALSLPSALVMTLTGGLLFGAWLGGFAAATSCTLGAVVIFLVGRTALGDSLQHPTGSAAQRIRDGVSRDAFSYVLMLRLVPMAPLWLANLALAFVEIPLTTYALATLLGILPVSLIYAHLGSELNHLFALGERPNLHLILRPQLLGPLVGLALLATAPILVRRWRGGR